MEDYRIRPYSKKELALEYFPTASPHVAVNHLMAWIKRCSPLHTALIEVGYQKNSKFFTPREVALIFDYLGTPG